MKRLLLLLGLAALTSGAAACGDDHPRPYANNDLELITAYTAKEVCSCRFVMNQTAEYCQAWTKASPPVATFRVDEKHKVVSAAALGLWSGRARWISATEGCRLERASE
ncbi:MAG: amidase [Deltaproteobacteria bacterium]|nr:amidase [Deltaproteobacteria bacterium]